MLDLFYMGGPLFMGILTLIFLAMLAVAFVNGTPVLQKKEGDVEAKARKLAYIKSVGLFALIVGFLGQLIGLFSAFQAIELNAVEVSPTLLASGFKISMITTIYGVLIYALSYLIWLGFSVALKKTA